MKVIKNIINALAIFIGSKGCAFAPVGAITPEKANGESTGDCWPEYESLEVTAKSLREAMAQGKVLGKSSPSLSPFDRRRFLSERKEKAPICITLALALKRKLVKPVTLTLRQGEKIETAQCYVLNRFDPAKGLAGKGATENGCQFIAIPKPIFGIQAGFVETRSINDGRNASLLVKIVPAKAGKAKGETKGEAKAKAVKAK